MLFFSYNTNNKLEELSIKKKVGRMNASSWSNSIFIQILFIRTNISRASFFFFF